MADSGAGAPPRGGEPGWEVRIPFCEQRQLEGDEARGSHGQTVSLGRAAPQCVLEMAQRQANLWTTSQSSGQVKPQEAGCERHLDWQGERRAGRMGLPAEETQVPSTLTPACQAGFDHGGATRACRPQPQAGGGGPAWAVVGRRGGGRDLARAAVWAVWHIPWGLGGSGRGLPASDAFVLLLPLSVTHTSGCMGPVLQEFEVCWAGGVGGAFHPNTP